VKDEHTDAKRLPENGVEAQDAVLSNLERQVERSSFFTHTALGRTAMRLGEVESFVYGLTDLLLAKGVLSSDEVTAAVQDVRQEVASKGEIPEPGVALRIDEPEAAQRPVVQVNCAARMHICHAICCQLDFALTSAEVESGKVKWDLGRPYFIRHEAHGFCTHNDRRTGGCSVYADRPVVCRSYSCANDTRIWKDFDKMELNVEWLTENLKARSPRVLGALMRNSEEPSEL
jgi:Fe-S-cluster containining protein